MMALPRSATRALGRWPWKHNDAMDTREGKPKDMYKTGFDVPTNTPEELKVPESQPVEHEGAPIVRSPSKLVKKRDPSGAKPKREKEAAAQENDGPVRIPIPTPAAEDADPAQTSRPATPSVDSETAERVVVPPQQPAPPTPKPNVLVKKNSLSKRAAAKVAQTETTENDNTVADQAEVPTIPSSLHEHKDVEQRPMDIAETSQVADGPTDPKRPDTPVEPIVPDTPPTSLPASEHVPSPSSPIHPFPVRGVTPPNGTRFIEGADGSLEPTETRTTAATGSPVRPARPQRRISLRSFGFFYGKDSRPPQVFPAYIPPAERVVHEVGEEVEQPATPTHSSARAHKRSNSLIPAGLLSPRKPAPPKVTKDDRRAVQSAVSLRTLIIGPAALDVKDRREGKKGGEAGSSTALRKVNQQLLAPNEANRVIAALRELPPPDLPPAAAETVETVRKKKGWVFGRGGNTREQGKLETIKGNTGTVAIPIHGCCLDITDEEAEERHFSKLTGSGGSAAGTETGANTGSADLSSLIPMLRDMRLVNLQASPDMSSVNAASLSAHLNAPDFGFGQPADKDGPLAGSVPSVVSLADGMEKVGQTLMSLGFASTTAVLPSHVGIHPPKDRMSVLTYWWGYEVVFPPPTMQYLSRVSSISSALLNFLTAFALFSNGVREMLPFIRYIAQFIDFEWNAIKAQDKGRGVVCAATWVMPAALVPRPWDFVDPPMKDKVAPIVTPGPAMHAQSTTSTSAGLAPQVSHAGFMGTATEAGETSANRLLTTGIRDGEPLSVRENEQEGSLNEQTGATMEDATAQMTDSTTPLPELVARPNIKYD